MVQPLQIPLGTNPSLREGAGQTRRQRASPPGGSKGLPDTFNQSSGRRIGFRRNNPIAVIVTERLDDEERHAIDREIAEIVFSEPRESTRPPVCSRSVNTSCDSTRALEEGRQWQPATLVVGIAA